MSATPSRALRPFHLAFPVSSLADARAFYGGLLGCPEGRSAEHWVDFDFFGHQLVAHLAPDETGASAVNAVDGDDVPVRGYSRSPKRIDGIETFAGDDALDACLDGAKVLVNLLPSTPATDGLLCARTFARLAPGAYLINVARGAHLVEADLLDALASGRIAAATLDVFQHEPLPADHPFWQTPRITITPHSSAETLRDEAVEQIAAKIRAFERGEPVGGIVDYARGY